MSTQLHSTRRLGLIAGICLIAVVAAAALWQIQLWAAPATVLDQAAYSGAAASDQMLVSDRFAVGLPYSTELQSDQDATAVLFLIDESGGVSGRCGDVDPSNVFVTDAEGRRHQLVRFYLQLWRAYYAFLEDQQSLDGVARPIYMGIMQFAKQDQSIEFLEVSAIGDLLGEQGADRFGQLQHQYTMLAGDEFDSDWFCWTDFPSALERAAEELNNAQAEHKVLVLLTDGSTRGNESEEESLAVRSAARQSIEETLRELNSSEIDVLTVIWRGDECIEENTCGLSTPGGEFEQRKDDLRGWESWESKDLLTLIDDKQAIKALAETSSFSPLLPGVGQYATGWIDSTSDQPSTSFFSEVARLLKVVAVTSDAISPSEIQFRPRSISGGGTADFAALDFRLHEPQWYSAEENIPGSGTTCPQRALEARISGSADSQVVLAYYWLPFEQDWPKIKSVSVEPEEIIIERLVADEIPPNDRTITVNVQMEPIDMNHHNCFLVQISVGDNTYARRLPSNDSHLLFPAIILPDDLVHGLKEITANLVFTNASEISAGVEKSTELNVVFQPIFPETLDFPNVTVSESLTVTVPITFAAQVPGFEPRFGLFPDTFDPNIAAPPPAAASDPTGEENCPPTQPLDDVMEWNSVTAVPDPDSQFVTNFVVAIPGHAMERCGYKHLLVMWTSLDQKGHKWLDLVAAKFEDPTSNPPPIPTVTDESEDGWENKWVLPLVILAAAVIVVVKAALWLKSKRKR
jgi:hypothetical protein